MNGQNGNDKPPSRILIKKLLIFLIFSFLASLIGISEEPRFIPDYREGDIAQRNIKAKEEVYVPEIGITLKKDEMVIREGERVTEEHLFKLRAVKAEETKKGIVNLRFLFLLLFFVCTLTVVDEFSRRNMRKYSLSNRDLIFVLSFTLFILLTMRVLLYTIKIFLPGEIHYLIYLVPFFLYGMVLRIVLFSEAAFIFTSFMTLAVYLIERDFAIPVYAFISSLLAAFFSGHSESRMTVIKAGLYSGIVTTFILILLSGFFGFEQRDILSKTLAVLMSGILSSLVAFGLLPIIENLFDYTTDIKLLELANLESPLMEQMMISAPGTYHHSIIVGNLSKAAAESIGAHPLLARVGAYYHDIGKLKMPHYYIENRQGFEDAHKNLTPNMSALIIMSHVKEGVELAERYKLGKKVKDIIAQHHGTSLCGYFYSKAKEKEDPTLHVIDETEFRYPGPKPQTKEAAIVMLADQVEASSRVLDDPTPKRIESHVRNMIEAIFLDGQLDECDLTLKDLHAIQRSFTSILTAMFHQRIEYPERKDHVGTASRKVEALRSGEKGAKVNRGRVIRLFGT